MAVDKLDLYKAHKDQYKATATPRILEIPPIPYLSVEGRGSPQGDDFMAAMTALYGMAYTLKFMHKEHGQDFTVAKLEGIWHPVGGFEQKIEKPSEMEWDYNLIIRMPEFVTAEDLPAAREQLAKKKREGEFERATLSIIEEGLVVQALHVGSYAEETPTLEKMHAYATEQGYRHLPSHHELYLSDPRRVEPAKLKTLLRTQIKKA